MESPATPLRECHPIPLPPPETTVEKPPPETSVEKPPPSPSQPPQMALAIVNRASRDELAVVTKLRTGGGVEEGFGARSRDGGETGSRAVTGILRRSRKEAAIKRAEIGVRVSALVFCLVSFSVLSADKTRGWAGDSFDRYREYRYLLAVNVLGFAYSMFQVSTQVHHMIKGKHIIRHPMRLYFDFSMDQILTYLLISASTAAATRNDDWISNWGNDEFTVMANGSISMSFLAFLAFALSSLISAYHLFGRNP